MLLYEIVRNSSALYFTLRSYKKNGTSKYNNLRGRTRNMSKQLRVASGDYFLEIEIILIPSVFVGWMKSPQVLSTLVLSSLDRYMTEIRTIHLSIILPKFWTTTKVATPVMKRTWKGYEDWCIRWDCRQSARKSAWANQAKRNTGTHTFWEAYQ